MVLKKKKIMQRICCFLYFRLIGSYSASADALRAFLFKRMTGMRMDGLVLRAGVYISGYSNIKVGSNVSIHHNSFISGEGGLTIGDNVSIAHGVSILTTEHAFTSAQLAIKAQPLVFHPVFIGDDVWIGAKATILAGVQIADGCIVGAGAVVTKSITEKNSIVAGVPARHIKGRFPNP